MTVEQLALDWTLDAVEGLVLALLDGHRGRGRAIRVADLARLAGIGERECQHVVHRLRCQHGQPIASAAGRPAGYYLPQTAEEIEAFVQEQRSKALGTLAAVAAVRRTTLPALLGQLAMEAQ